MRFLFHFLGVLIVTLGTALCSEAAAIAEDRQKAVIISYNRIGEDTYPATSLRIEQFQEHLRTLQTDEYNVLPLPAILDALKNGNELPQNTLAITFEGGYRSAYEHAMKPLLATNIPFSIVVATDFLDVESPQHISWDILRDLQKSDLVDIALLPADGQRLMGRNRSDILGQTNRARAAFRKKTGKAPSIFSYPYGEYSTEHYNMVKEQGFEAALGLQSGVLYEGSDIFALPRFAMTESHGDIDRFNLVTRALPLPATSIEPSVSLIDNETPLIGFSIPASLQDDMDKLSCFLSGEGKIDYQALGQSRVEIRLDTLFNEDRIRINCTIPGVKNPDGTTNWRWLGMLLVRPEASILPQDELQ